ncbi:peroxisomal targeting signal receptor [Ophiostoma piceae UAMH 11346]|uniref:Peroxisomal targeting signal receptor n=1 Tax=Ophiostoma piceae (strain UAMH 11346) TaxID=1262450 RepID=S3BY72_OPHP1|nr:peroxisomal targeting signal receptor [Ophiostoma piceae UAMH 11346]
MSFMGGAECSTAGNPLSQFTKHVQDDRSLQRDRLVNGGPSGALNSFRSAGRGAVSQDDMVQGFLQNGPNMPEMAMEHHGPMSPLQLDPASRSTHLRAQSASPVWSDAFRPPPSMDSSAFNPEEFAKFQQQHHPAQQQMGGPAASASAQVNAGQAQNIRSMMGSPMGAVGYDMPYMNMNMGGMNSMYRPMMQNNWAQQQQQQNFQPQEATVEGKGKGKVVELNDTEWEEQFARMEMQDKEALAEATVKEHDEDQEANDAIERELNRVDEENLMCGGETNYGDLEAVWNGIQAENAAMRTAFDGDEWKDVSDNFQSYGDDWEPLNYRMGMDPRAELYQFEDDNLFKKHNNPFEEGVRIMNENGNLSLAALAFEAACQREPDRVEAWTYLGQAQAQNEKETAAIRALEHALTLDSTNLPGLMALAVSYTNEGYDTTAYRTLERWLSAKYPQVLPPAELSNAAEVGFTDRQQLHDRITQKFIEAAQLSPDGEHMDPDVQVGLGVLFYGGEDFDKAVDCFHAGLYSSEQGTSNQRSQVHLLWNRLGATLANSGRSEEAIAAYEKALSMHPNFVRARYNLGVSCINMGCYDEAASHLLAALSMHKDVEKNGREEAREILGGAAAGITDEHLERMTTQNRSTTLHDTLRRVFGLMDRRDLADRVAVDMDPDVFRGEFDF